MKSFKIVKYIVGIFCLYLSSVAFAATPDPLIMLQGTADKVIGALKANQPKLHDNKQIVYGIVYQYLIPNVDVAGMARSVLGRNAWMQATAAQKESFTNEFVKLVVRTYANPLSDYKDEVIKFLPLRGGYENQSFMTVHSAIIRSSGNNVPLDYSIVLLKNEWKIYDMSVEGVSLLQSFRSQFADQLQQGDLNQLIQKLQQHNKKAGQ